MTSCSIPKTTTNRDLSLWEGVKIKVPAECRNTLPARSKMTNHQTPNTIILQDTDTANEALIELLLTEMELASGGGKNELEARQATKKYLVNTLTNLPANYTILELKVTAENFYSGYLKALTAHSSK